MIDQFIFCTGLVCKPNSLSSHFDEYSRLVGETVGSDDFLVQVNVDWRPPGVSVQQLLDHAHRRFGDRLRSVVTYWDPAHSFDEILSLLPLCREAMPGGYLRILLRSQESIRMLRHLVEYVDHTASDDPRFLLGIDSLGESAFQKLRSETRLRSDTIRFRYQMSNQTPASHLRGLLPTEIGSVQVAIGSPQNISATGEVILDDGMVVAGRYSLPKYLSDAEDLTLTAPRIIMGPTLPQWTAAENSARLTAVWKHLGRERWAQIRIPSEEQVAL